MQSYWNFKAHLQLLVTRQLTDKRPLIFGQCLQIIRWSFVYNSLHLLSIKPERTVWVLFKKFQDMSGNLIKCSVTKELLLYSQRCHALLIFSPSSFKKEKTLKLWGYLDCLQLETESEMLTRWKKVIHNENEFKWLILILIKNSIVVEEIKLGKMKMQSAAD